MLKWCYCAKKKEKGVLVGCSACYLTAAVLGSEMLILLSSSEWIRRDGFLLEAKAKEDGCKGVLFAESCRGLGRL